MTNVDRFREIAKELGDLYEKKNLAYGNSFSDTYNKLGIISAITRISDKYNRLCNLVTNPDIDNLGESLDDTLRDMAAYCIMAVIELSKKTAEADKIIHKGDTFLCLHDIHSPDGEKTFNSDCYYISEDDGCISDNDGNSVLWLCDRDCTDWRKSFKRVKKID
jgi:hypothetical protein